MKVFEGKKGLLILGVIGGLMAMTLAIFGNPKNMALCIACFIRDIAGSMKLHQTVTVQYFRPEIVGIIGGSLVMSLARKEYKSTAGSSPMIRFFLGMMTMIGALVFLGCPLRMILRMAGGDLNAYIALIGFLAGIATGAFFLKKGYTLGRSYETRPVSGAAFTIVLAAALIVSVATGLFAMSQEGPGSQHAPILIALGCALVFGAAAQVSRMCFAGSFRNAIFTRDISMFLTILGVFAVMLIYNIASGQFQLTMEGQPVAHTEWIWNILGMYVVGFAATLAGGCPLRQLVLTGQGSSDAAVNVLGMLVGGAFAHNFQLASSAEGTTAGGRIVTVVMILLLFVIAAVHCKQEKEA